MKTLLSLLLLITTLASAQERYVTLIRSEFQTGLPYSFQLLTNQIATVVSAGSNYGTTQIKADFQTPLNYAMAWLWIGETITGPAHITVSGTSTQSGASSIVTLLVRPVQSTSTAGAITAAPLPAGVGARVTLEESGDLVAWSSVAPGDFSKTETNRFYRVRMILAQ